ncbi:MAG: small multi-drug export protein [Bacillota bacterium]|nr:small multi-drug export protein [Bacillota bacterium]
MVEVLVKFLAGIPLEWQVFILAMIPVTELRAAIPYGITQGLLPLTTLTMAAIGNMLIGLPVLVLISPIINIIKKVPLGERVVDKVLAATRLKGNNVVKYGTIGLAIFVSIPLPGTGVWTGSLLAYLFGIKIGTAFVALCMGVMIAAVIITLLSLGLIELIGSSTTSIILVVLFLIIAPIIWRLIKRNC